MEQEKLTAKEWADINADALVNRNRELLVEMIKGIDTASRVIDKEREKIHWRRVFAAAAIEGGKSCVDAIAISDKMIARMFD